MENPDQIDPDKGESRPSHGADLIDIAALAAPLGTSDLGPIAVLGLVIVVPLMAIGLIRAIWRAAVAVVSRVCPLLDYRRYLNGGTW